MQRDHRIEGSPAIVHEAAGWQELWAFLQKVHSRLSEDDYRYPFYLTWLAESASNAARSRLGPDSIESLENRLNATNPNHEEFDEELVEGIAEYAELEEYRFSLLFVLTKLYLELGEVSNAVRTIEDYKDEFGEKPLFRVLRADVLSQQGTQESIDTSLEEAWRAREAQSDWPEVQKGLAKIIVEALDHDLVYEGFTSGIPSEREELLDIAKQSIDQALSVASEHPEYLLLKGKIQALDGQFESSKRTIREAIEHLSPHRAAYDRVLTQYRIELSNVDLREQEAALKEETSQAIDQLEDLQGQYEEASRRYQTQMLQFLGFFTGIIGIVIVSAQVTIQVGSAESAMRLIMVLIGGLIFSFGAFSFVLPDVDPDETDYRTLVVLAAGAILIGIAGFLM